MNIVLAFLIFTAIAVPGEPYGLPVVSRVSEGYPAAASGIREGDRVKAVNGAPVATWDEMSRAIKESDGRGLELALEREGAPLVVKVIPVSRDEEGEGEKRYVIGIQGPAEFARKPIPLWRAPVEGAAVTWEVVALTGDALWRLVTGRGSRADLMGPIGIAVETGEAAKRGAIYLFTLLAALSVNLGVLNLLPIPVLDGGHLLFLGYEAARGKPLNRRVREVALQIGFFLLLGLMGFVILNDIFRIVAK
jgi:regulator of sigma E protease